jgi:hypothetical protein
MLHWDLVQVARGLAAHVAFTIAALASAGLVGMGVAILGIWSPFTLTSTVTARADPATPTLASILGEHRGGIAFLIVMLWLLLVATALAPAFIAATIVRDRRAGRLDRILLDTGRADLVAIGKLFGGLIPMLMVLLVAAPAASFAWMIGGITRFDAVSEALTVLLLVVLVAAISLLCSAVARTETEALLASYCAIACVFLVPLAATAILIASGQSDLANAIASFDPIVALLAGQPELMRSLARLVSDTLPSPPVVWTLREPLTLTAPVWAVDAAAYAVLAVALIWLSGVALEPLHPLKTRRLRRRIEVAR